MGCLVYISVAAVTAAGGSTLTAGHFWQTPGMPAQPKLTQRSLPHRSVPRLRSASVVDGACQIKSRATHDPSDQLRSKCGSGLARECGGSGSPCVTDTTHSRASPLPQFDRVQPPAPHCFAFLWELACLRCRQLGVSGITSRCHRRQASSHIWLSSASRIRSAVRPPRFCFYHSGRLLGRRAVDFDLDLRRPVKPRWPHAGFGAWVNRQDAGLAVLGHGWPIAAAHAPKPA